MGKYFDDLHAMPDSQLGNAPCRILDSPEVAAARGAPDFDGMAKLARALSRQLRYREALRVYALMLRLKPDDTPTIRARVPWEINTLQPRLAIADLLRCRAGGWDEADVSYRFGIASYLAGDYPTAMWELATCFPLVDDEMGIAAMYWHTMAAWRHGAVPELLQHYRPDMKCGHHTAYAAVMSFAAGRLPRNDLLKMIGDTKSDLEFSMLAYGASVYLWQEGAAIEGRALRRQIIARDSFWISYAYLAAWNDEYFGGIANGQ